MSYRPSEPTPLHRRDRAPQILGWLSLAERTQLETDLLDLPELIDQLDRHYDALLARGSRNPDDPWIRYPVSVGVLDLADRRAKDGAIVDPIGEADLARRIGERRTGAIPALAAWVSLAVGEMHDLDVPHDPPMDHDRIVWVAGPEGIHATRPGVTATSEAGWLARHLDWIGGQQWVIELAGDVRRLVCDLEQAVGPAYAAPNPHTVGTITELAAWTGIPASTLYRWREWLTPAGTNQRGVALWYRAEVEGLRRTRGVA